MKRFSIVLALSLSACFGTAMSEKEFRALREGRTTRTQVRKKFGEPYGTMISGKFECDIYYYAEVYVQGQGHQLCYTPRGVLKHKARSVSRGYL